MSFIHSYAKWYSNFRQRATTRILHSQWASSPAIPGVTHTGHQFWSRSCFHVGASQGYCSMLLGKPWFYPLIFIVCMMAITTEMPPENFSWKVWRRKFFSCLFETWIHQSWEQRAIAVLPTLQRQSEVRKGLLRGWKVNEIELLRSYLPNTRGVLDPYTSVNM